MSDLPIGIFDSGVGGLTVLKEIKNILPNESIIYLGDNIRNPYGSKSISAIKKISFENTDFLLSKNIKLLVVACNTASAVAITHLKNNFNIPIIGVIEGGVFAALKSSVNKKIGVIGTRQTINSNVHKNLINQLNPQIEVFTKATPLFAPLVEEGLIDNISTNVLIKEELTYFKDCGVDTLILGCTHYPLLKNKISSFLSGVNLIDPAEETALFVSDMLKITNLKNVDSFNFEKIFVTDSPENFVKIGGNLVDLSFIAVELVDTNNFLLNEKLGG